jgi:hypothetical protein
MNWKRKWNSKITHFQLICVFMQEIFFGATFKNQNENLYTVMWLCKVYYVSFSFWFNGGVQENYSYNDTDFCSFLLKMGNFAVPLPVSSHIDTLELFPTQNLIWISIAWYFAKVWAKLRLLNSKFYFHPLIGPNHAILALVLYILYLQAVLVAGSTRLTVWYFYLLPGC